MAYFCGFFQIIEMSKLLLIADSGSSKTDWKLIDSGSTLSSYEGLGLNPDFHSEESLVKQLEEVKQHLGAHLPNEIYFYGSGASSSKRKQPLLNAFGKVFQQVNCKVDHDLLGAAIAAHE